MKSKKRIFYFIVIISFCQCKISHYKPFEEPVNNNTRKKFVPTGGEGKCFAKCLIMDEFEMRSKEIIVFTGDETLEDVDLDYRKVITKQKRNKWIKKKANRNCLSSNPDDCLVWCVVEELEESEKIKILVDTTQSKNFEIRKIAYEVVKQKGGLTEWRPTLCKEDQTESIVAQIQNSLIEYGYYDGEITNSIDAATKAGLVKFQKDYQLPVGNLDLETLDVLGVVID